VFCIVDTIGACYSSLSNLKRFAIDTLRFDQWLAVNLDN